MEIEKISENQVKIVLNKADLKDRNLKIGELAYGSEKTQELFREMMLQALIECDFHTDNTPLMIEAIPMSTESVTIIVTKVSNPEDIEHKFNLFQQEKEPATPKKRASSTRKNANNQDHLLIYSFNQLNPMIDACDRIAQPFHGQSSIYKYKNKFYLILEHVHKNLEIPREGLELILNEYGEKQKASALSKQFFIEHGEVFVKRKAVTILSEHLGN